MPNSTEIVAKAQWIRFSVIARVVHGLRVKEKRQIFVCMREDSRVNENAFLPHFGFTCGEFALFHVLNNSSGPQSLGSDLA